MAGVALLVPDAGRHFYEKNFEDCRLIYGRIPSPRKKLNSRASLETIAAVEKVVSSDFADSTELIELHFRVLENLLIFSALL
jgi:hypothetical protein